MKKKNKKNQVRKRFSTLLLFFLAIVLCAAPRGWAFNMYCTEDVVYYDVDVLHYDDEDGEYDVTEQLINTVRDEPGLEGELDMLEVGAGATVNLYTDVLQSVYVYPGGILNIYSSSVGWFVFVSPPSPDEPDAVVTVYGTDFAVSNGTIQPDGTWTPDSKVGKGTLTGYYGGGDGSSIDIDLSIFSDTPINLQPPPSSGPEEIQIDIKPGGNPNNINLKSKGVVPVAVFTTDDFDASTIDPGTVTFAGASTGRWKLDDVDGDGDLDMLFHFKTQYLVDLDENSTKATLTGTTFGGEDIELTDEVRIVVPGKK